MHKCWDIHHTVNHILHMVLVLWYKKHMIPPVLVATHFTHHTTKANTSYSITESRKLITGTCSHHYNYNISNLTFPRIRLVQRFDLVQNAVCHSSDSILTFLAAVV